MLPLCTYMYFISLILKKRLLQSPLSAVSSYFGTPFQKCGCGIFVRQNVCHQVGPADKKVVGVFRNNVVFLSEPGQMVRGFAEIEGPERPARRFLRHPKLRAVALVGDGVGDDPVPHQPEGPLRSLLLLEMVGTQEDRKAILLKSDLFHIIDFVHFRMGNLLSEIFPELMFQHSSALLSTCLLSPVQSPIPTNPYPCSMAVLQTRMRAATNPRIF